MLSFGDDHPSLRTCLIKSHYSIILDSQNYIDSFLSSYLCLSSELSALTFGTLNPRRIGKTCWKRVILKTVDVRIKMIFDSESAPLKTLGDSVSKSLEAWMLINFNFSDKTHENSAKLSAKQAENAIIDYPNTKIISQTMSIWVFNVADSESKIVFILL